MIDKYKLHKALKKMFKEVKNINDISIFALYVNNRWEICFNANPNNKLIPNHSISLWLEFKKGYESHSISLTTDLIYEKLKSVENTKK